eukprot:COSAG01_NODE_47357_length_391_cov_0.708904_1_plen_82_part_10
MSLSCLSRAPCPLTSALLCTQLAALGVDERDCNDIVHGIRELIPTHLTNETIEEMIRQSGGENLDMCNYLFGQDVEKVRFLA